VASRAIVRALGRDDCPEGFDGVQDDECPPEIRAWWVKNMSHLNDDAIVSLYSRMKVDVWVGAYEDILEIARVGCPTRCSSHSFLFCQQQISLFFFFPPSSHPVHSYHTHTTRFLGDTYPELEEYLYNNIDTAMVSSLIAENSFSILKRVKVKGASPATTDRTMAWLMSHWVRRSVEPVTSRLCSDIKSTLIVWSSLLSVSGRSGMQ
jgi:hypothetical protein